MLLALVLAFADPISLAEAPGPSRCELTLKVRGTLKLAAGDQPLVAEATHTFADYPDRPGRSVRVYTAASATSTVAGERSRRELPADRRRIVADRRTHYSPAGPLTRDTLELVAEHLDPQAVAALLPSAPVAIGGTWAVSAEAVQLACHLDGVTSSAITGTLTAGGPQPTFTLTGTAEGVDNGASVKLTVNATGTFDPTARRVVKLSWEQTDTRTARPASPASELTATAELTRTTAAPDPAALAGLPAGDAVPEHLLALAYADPAGRYTLAHSRDWFVTGRAADHLVLRLIDGGAFVAQATVTAWKPAAAGGHTPADQFRAALAKLPGWEPEAELAAGELPTSAGWLYRVSCRGKQDGKPVVQTAYLLAAPSGNQLAVGVLAAPQAAVQGRDERLVRGLGVR